MFPLRTTNIENSLLSQFAKVLASVICSILQAFQFLQCQEITKCRLHAKFNRRFDSYSLVYPLFSFNINGVTHYSNANSSHFIRTVAKLHQ